MGTLTMIDIKPGKFVSSAKSNISVDLPEGHSFSFDMHCNSGTLLNIYHL